MRHPKPSADVRAGDWTRAAFVVLALVVGGCTQCPTCPKHTDPAHLDPPADSH